MLPRSVTLAGVLVALPAMMAPLEAKAGGHCREIECYEKVRTGPVYGTVATPVVVAPARTKQRTRPAHAGRRGAGPHGVCAHTGDHRQPAGARDGATGLGIDASDAGGLRDDPADGRGGPGTGLLHADGAGLRHAAA